MRTVLASPSSGRVALPLLLLLAASAVAPCDETWLNTPVPRDQLPYLPQVERFIDAVERADIGTAIDTLQWTGDASSQLKQQLAETATKLGRSDGHEFIAVRRISPRLHQIYGVIHFERQPLMFVLHPRLLQGAWRIQTVTFSADPKALGEMAPLEPIAPAKDEKIASSSLGSPQLR
ncbi:MAG: hypothetical protein ACYC6Y_15965 [Thermoguttaceae bacterium]